MRIGVDLSSAEKDSLTLFLSVVEFIEQNSDVEVLVFIEQSLKSEFVAEYPHIPSSCEVIFTTNDVKMDDIPSSRLLSRKKSAIIQGLNKLKKQHIDAFFSPGNSGAIILLASQIISMREGVSFPAVGVLIPREKDIALLLDIGASFDFDEERILELVYLGREYFYKSFKGVEPVIGILNVGKEKYKGPLSLKRVDRFLTKSLPEEYLGFLEGNDIFKNQANIFITNAYTGNIILKSWEGFLSYLFCFIHEHIPKQNNEENTPYQAEKILSLLKNNFHYSHVGAAVILGLKQPVFLGHGRTSRSAISGALRLIKGHLLNQVEELPVYRKKRSDWAKQFQKK